MIQGDNVERWMIHKGLLGDAGRIDGWRDCWLGGLI